ncbi:MAG: hypothetical protein J7L82_06445, partial [Staphylothermus sp.]|nr:hypothetical protein [Staphylothermus sp.]
MKTKLGNINYRLTLYYSYLLPLFRIELTDNTLVFTKEYGSCKELKCIQNNDTIECVIPYCKPAEYKKILGIDKKKIIDESMDK